MSPSADHFIQPKITGYRQLSAEEGALINEVKKAGAAFEEAVAKVRVHVSLQRRLAHNDDAPELRSFEQQRLDAAEPERWAALGRTAAQEATMFLVRAVAQPAS